MTRGGRLATEWVWMNYPHPLHLHDYRFLGEGFRERERIKRKKQRWVNRLHSMPILERRALLAAIEEAWPRPSPDTAMPDRALQQDVTRAAGIAGSAEGEFPRSPLAVSGDVRDQQFAVE
jgi:hypothetical protein